MKQQRVCPVCGTTHDVGVILHRQLKPVLERTTITGYDLCPTCKGKIDEGYIAMVECDPAKSNIEGKQTMQVADAYRTGNMAWISRKAFGEIFNIPVPDKGLTFIEPDVFAYLERIAP